MTSTRRWGAVWTLLVASGGLYFLSDNQADNDLWVHLRLGLDVLAAGPPRVDGYSYTAAGALVIDHEWLVHALFGGVYRLAGGRGLLLLKLAAGLATLALVARSVARRSTSAHVRGAVLVLATAVLARGFAVRPQIFTYLGLAALWAFLDDRRWRDSSRRWLLVPAFMLWANLHGGVLLGVGVTSLCAAWLLASRSPREGILLAAALLLGVAGAIALNPYGLAYGDFLGREFGAPHPITEWQPVALEASQATFLALAAAFAVSLPFLEQWRERGWQAVLAALLLAGSLLQQRHTPAFALCAAPLVAEGAAQLLARLQRERRWSLSREAQGLLAAALVLLAVVQLGVAAQRLARDRFQIVFEPHEYPVQAVQWIAAAGWPLNLAVPLEWGGYVLWHLGPRVKVSLDGRFAMVYPAATVQDNFAFFGGRDGWRRLIDAYPTEAVLAPAGALPPVATIPGWRRLYDDGVATLLAREGIALDELPGGPPAPGSPAPRVFP